MIRSNVDYSLGVLSRVAEVISCYEISTGRLRVETNKKEVFYFKEILPNHWVREDSVMTEGVDR